jgi:hypothetical protein
MTFKLGKGLSSSESRDLTLKNEAKKEGLPLAANRLCSDEEQKRYVNLVTLVS